MLKNVLCHKIPILVSCNGLQIKDKLVEQESNMLLTAMLNESLQDTAAELMPRHCRRMPTKTSRDTCKLFRRHDLNKFCQDMIGMRRQVQICGMWEQLLDKLFALLNSCHLDCSLYNPGTTLGERQLQSRQQNPIHDCS